MLKLQALTSRNLEIHWEEKVYTHKASNRPLFRASVCARDNKHWEGTEPGGTTDGWSS